MRLLLPVIAVALLAAPAGLAKEGVEAELLRPLPEAASGEAIELAWMLGYREDGKWHPFSASAIFVRLESATGGPPTMAFAEESALGRHVARVAVPRGGIGAVRIGVRGTTDFFFPVRSYTSKTLPRTQIVALVRIILARLF